MKKIMLTIMLLFGLCGCKDKTEQPNVLLETYYDVSLYFNKEKVCWLISYDDKTLEIYNNELNVVDYSKNNYIVDFKNIFYIYTKNYLLIIYK